jgi:heme-degrading monooxygenase HmoA
MIMKLFVSLTLTILLMTSSTSESPASYTITRIWHGWTTKENADSFERTLTNEAIPNIEKNRPSGCLSIQLLRKESANEVEFTTIMVFDSMEAVRQFAGEDYEAAHIDPEVKPLLLRYDLRVAHYQTRYSKIW